MAHVPGGRTSAAGYRRLIVLAAVLAAVQPAAPVAGQGTTLAGRVVDTAGVAVPALDVVLHRVDGSGGARLATGATDDNGAFRLSTDAAPVADAVYFVAARVDGDLFIGPFVRPPLEATTDYTVVVGGEPVDFGGMAVPAGGIAEVAPPVRGRRIWLAVLPALGLLGVGLVAAKRLRGPSERRRLLIRVASLDNAPPPPDPAARDEERERLVERLLSMES